MYLLHKDAQDELLQKLALTEISEGGWTRVYVDPSTGSGWLSFRYPSEKHGRGRMILRENPPPADLADWLDKCFSSGNDDDIRGLSWELSRDHEKWPAILGWLESHSDRLSADQIRLFVENLEVLHLINRYPVVGKTPTEIKKDYGHFELMARRARQLLKLT